ncbi:L-serine ammonia-lyase, iron-sulfur-dependent, subunit alpha [Ohessyouella blattaphilus]|uniref:L-serine dehydratase n=1 Tax=Ohessyouella blattaphilus TaxID=2949333 RepID=A0ABT1EEL4_9FIRM|nr:L-serine ammonia-lyase, iron-sulfur-dependent, subunit alpha [Ohessyouella blattaphilus]MCP1108934.1 L-serine ammonia-lyase, iron-sulfur-dependent, subunit alpha [Ohessyouella blattaphilus]MCR8562328.1 L-serine ammonia-lyase, iron-sulfur-dependent, subunit alpha [Ohessyouella blattaphilus]
MSFTAMEDIRAYCEEERVSFWEAILIADADARGVSKEKSIRTMNKMWLAMKENLDNYDRTQYSRSHLVGPEGGLMADYQEKGESLCGDFMAKVMTNALKMGCNNACMKRIVAAPTAGACGVLPAVLVTYYEEKQVSDDAMVESLYVAAGVGDVIGNRAFLAGAMGGCQAEIGSAAAMAAAAITYLKGGDIKQMMNATAMALKNMMGLVCDPVGGLVEVPCVKRNVAGAVNALSAADMALAGIESQIPVDQVIDAMKEVGDRMDVAFKETGTGGVAGSERAKEVMKNLQNRQ